MIPLLVALIGFFLVCSFFFSGIETGLISIDRLQLEQDSREDRRKRDLMHFLERPERIFGTTLIGNNISNTMIATLAVYLVNLSGWNLEGTAITLITTAVVLVFCETIPKALFRDRPNQLVPALFPILKGIYFLLSPFVRLITKFNHRFSGMFRVNGHSYQFLTREDLSNMLAEAQPDENLHEHQREMLEEAMGFGETNAHDVMTPRIDMVAIPADATVAEALAIAKQEQFTRYPVYRDDIDHVVGMLIVYDLIGVDPNSSDTVGKYAREAFFVPEKMDISALLKEMQVQKKSVAIVVDSFGGTAGLVTSEDILEEVVGEIEDEYDTETDADVQQIDDHTYVVQGDVEVDDLIDNYDIDLPNDGDYKTIAGLIIDKLARIPGKGQKLMTGDWKIEVLQVTTRKIQKVRLTRQAKPDTE
jgi:CBS domain containing-hemolysin-like protein